MAVYIACVEYVQHTCWQAALCQCGRPAQYVYSCTYRRISELGIYKLDASQQNSSQPPKITKKYGNSTFTYSTSLLHFRNQRFFPRWEAVVTKVTRK